MDKRTSKRLGIVITIVYYAEDGAVKAPSFMIYFKGCSTISRTEAMQEASLSARFALGHINKVTY